MLNKATWMQRRINVAKWSSDDVE